MNNWNNSVKELGANDEIVVRRHDSNGYTTDFVIPRDQFFALIPGSPQASFVRAQLDSLEMEFRNKLQKQIADIPVEHFKPMIEERMLEVYQASLSRMLSDAGDKWRSEFIDAQIKAVAEPIIKETVAMLLSDDSFKSMIVDTVKQRAQDQVKSLAERVRVDVEVVVRT